MIAPCSPPETYQQWLNCFEYLRQHPLDRQVLEELSLGRYMGQPAEAFLVRLSDTVGLVITAYCRRFLRQVDIAFEDGEPDMVALLAARLKRNLQLCFFYRNLPFLEAGYIRTLDEGYIRQLEAFWKDFLAELQRTAKDSQNPHLEDTFFELKRMKLL